MITQIVAAVVSQLDPATEYVLSNAPVVMSKSVVSYV